MKKIKVNDKQLKKGEKFESPVIDIDDDTEVIRLLVDRSQLTGLVGNDVCNCLCEVDSGAGFVPWGGISLSGEDHYDRGGTLLTHSTYSVNLPSGTGRKMRVITDAFEKLHFKIEVDHLNAADIAAEAR